MKIVIAGCNGQLGRSLANTAPANAQLVRLASAVLDISDPAAVADQISRHRPDIIINAAAYTAVDRAEAEEDRAFAVNATGPALLAEAARRCGARLVHISTDFVFSGDTGIPYRTDSPTAPLSAYGRSKLAGEQAAGSDALILRTAWVYGPDGNNFVRTMLRLMAERPEIKVVADQIGTPTYAPALAEAIWGLIAAHASGIYHYTDSGVASWYDFAVAIQEEALDAGLLTRRTIVTPIATVDFPTPARRPHFSVLDKSATVALLGKPPPHWREQLRKMMATISADS